MELTNKYIRSIAEQKNLSCIKPVYLCLYRMIRSSKTSNKHFKQKFQYKLCNLNKFWEIFFSLKKIKCLECPETLKTAKIYFLVFLGPVPFFERLVLLFWDWYTQNRFKFINITFLNKFLSL